MKKNIGALIFIFICTSIAWMILGGATTARTHSQDNKLKSAVGQLWGTYQYQNAPYVYYLTKGERKYSTIRGSETVIETRVDTVYHSINLDASNVKVDFDLAHRKKGLLWYSTYRVKFRSKYIVSNSTGTNQNFYFQYTFPTSEGVYDDFSFIVDGEKARDVKPEAGQVTRTMNLDPGAIREIEIAYASQGMDQWWYVFGSGVSHIQNFQLTMTTNFDDIDFPENSISPTSREKTDSGWTMTWEYGDLISGIQIGLAMPQKVNPGPFVSRVTFFAPVSLFLFLFLILIITTLQERKIHPMNYFFVCGAFFSFHLLLAYLADHVDIHLALIIASAVAIFLVISYMRLVAGTKFAWLEIGISQFVYLVLFSYTFFLKGYTGLAITILCILTLFIVMQLTGRVDWHKQFAKEK